MVSYQENLVLYQELRSYGNYLKNLRGNQKKRGLISKKRFWYNTKQLWYNTKKTWYNTKFSWYHTKILWYCTILFGIVPKQTTFFGNMPGTSFTEARKRGVITEKQIWYHTKLFGGGCRNTIRPTNLQIVGLSGVAEVGSCAMNAWRNGHAKFDPRAHSSYSTRRGAFSIVARIYQLRGMFKSATFVVERTPSTLSCFECHDLHIASKYVFKNTHKKRKDDADL